MRRYPGGEKTCGGIIGIIGGKRRTTGMRGEEVCGGIMEEEEVCGGIVEGEQECSSSGGSARRNGARPHLSSDPSMCAYPLPLCFSPCFCWPITPLPSLQ